MGSYLTRLPYLNYGYQPENNNIMDSNIAVQAKKPKAEPEIPNYFKRVDVSTELTINTLQSSCKKDSFVVMRLWNRLSNYYEPRKRDTSYEEGQISSVTPITSERECKSNNFCSFNSKPPQKSPSACLQPSQDRPISNILFQRLDSGIEEYTPYRIRAQVDLDGLHFTMINTVDNQRACFLKEDLICGPNGRFQPSISFFIDLRDPLKQKPLGEKYKFMYCDECDSMFSEEASAESCNEDCVDDDDFIVFESCCSEENYGNGLNLTFNSCTPAELSCSVSSNSTATTYVDTSTKTSPISSSGIGYENNRIKRNESSLCVEIGIIRSGICSTSNNPSTFLNTTNSGKSAASTIEAVSDNTFCKSSACTPKKTCKKVCFQNDDKLVVVYQMRHWDFAYREARKGPWELAAVDRYRFWRRIQDMEAILSPILRRKLESIQEL